MRMEASAVGAVCRTAVWGLLGLSAACGAPRTEFLSSPATADLGLPFSEAVRVGDTLYVSGQIGNLPGTLELAPGGLEGQTRQALANMAAVLERHGSSLEQVVKCTLFLEHMADWPAVNAIYVEFFPGRKPARSALGADGLALGALLEIECIAVVSR